MTLAVVTGAHGIAGEVRLKVFAQDLSAYSSFNDGALTLKAARPAGPTWIARFAEIADRTAAEALRGTELTVPRDALPPLGEGEYYHHDLIGLAVCDKAGASRGYVVAVENHGAGDILEVERSDGGRVLVSAATATLGDPIVVPDAFLS